MIVPKVPTGVSGTALAASLLRDGWSVCPISSILFNLCIYVSNITWLPSLCQLAKIYEKYQEATDALRHERFGRRHAEAVLERVQFCSRQFIS